MPHHEIHTKMNEEVTLELLGPTYGLRDGEVVMKEDGIEEGHSIM